MQNCKEWYTLVKIVDTSDTAVLNIAILLLKFVFKQEMWLVSKNVQLYGEEMVSILAPLLHFVNDFAVIYQGI